MGLISVLADRGCCVLCIRLLSLQAKLALCVCLRVRVHVRVCVCVCVCVRTVDPSLAESCQLCSVQLCVCVCFACSAYVCVCFACSGCTRHFSIAVSILSVTTHPGPRTSISPDATALRRPTIGSETDSDPSD